MTQRSDNATDRTIHDYRQLARKLQDRKGITRREAIRRVIKEHGEEARSAFIGPPLRDQTA